MRSKCPHLGAFVPGTAGRRPRTCSRGVNGGAVLKVVDCERCTLHPDAPAPSAPCAHVGQPVPPPDGKPSEMRWTLCDHPKRIELQIAEAVCPCRGCGSKCKGYEPDE
jgi:hypothetical protein